MSEQNSPGVHVCALEVRWGDSDRLGHVNNVSYLEYLQESRIRFFSTLSDGDRSVFGAFVVRRVEIDYLAPLFDHSTPLRIESRIEHIGQSSIIVLQEIHGSRGERAATARTVLAAFDVQTNGKRTLTQEERTVLAPFSHSLDQAGATRS